MKTITKILPHITLILAVMFIVFLVLDNYNPTMNFVNNDISVVLLWILCGTALVNALLLMVKERR
ncbi:MAG: hypothetical protein HGA54_06525 [Actinobacteria bacterium]|nr:hypothetical protein [Actinomycetota bacterium]